VEGEFHRGHDRIREWFRRFVSALEDFRIDTTEFEDSTTAYW
jgi:hypothetical protein